MTCLVTLAGRGDFRLFNHDYISVALFRTWFLNFSLRHRLKPRLRGEYLARRRRSVPPPGINCRRDGAR